MRKWVRFGNKQTVGDEVARTLDRKSAAPELLKVLEDVRKLALSGRLLPALRTKAKTAVHLATMGDPGIVNEPLPLPEESTHGVRVLSRVRVRHAHATELGDEETAQYAYRQTIQTLLSPICRQVNPCVPTRYSLTQYRPPAIILTSQYQAGPSLPPGPGDRPDVHKLLR
jgi:hypothetical protein